MGIMNVRVLLLAGLVFAVTLGLFLWILRVLEKRRAAIQRRLESQGAGSDANLLIETATATEIPKGWFTRMDRGFEGMIGRTGMVVEPDQALGFIALVAVGLAAILFLWRGELWLSILGLILGGGGTLVAFLVMQSRFRRQMSEQLPDAFYLLARSLRGA